MADHRDDPALGDAFRTALRDLPTQAPPLGHVKALAGPRTGGLRGATATGWASPRRRVAVGLGMAAATAAAVAAPSVLPLGESGAPIDAATADVLVSAAGKARARAAAPLPRPGQVVYLRSVGIQATQGEAPAGGRADGNGKGCGFVYESWKVTGSSGEGRITRVDGVRTPALGWSGDPTTLPAAPGCVKGAFTTANVPVDGGTWQSPSAEFVAGLPTDAERLHERATSDVVRDGHGDRKEHETFVYLSDLLVSTSPYLTPEVKAATLRALALVPGVQQVGSRQDAAGRPGLGIAGPADPDGGGAGDVLILDQATGDLLGRASADYSLTNLVRIVPAVGDRGQG